VSHWIIAPIVMPAVVAALIVLTVRHNLFLQRTASLASATALAVIAVSLMLSADTGVIEVYRLGNWPAPFGIVLVLDRFSALMVLLTGLLAVTVLLYAIGSGWDERGRNFHALYQFQLMGICGAFLTGDIFNLFVFFEVLLIASYGLMIHGGGQRRLRAGVQYVVYNLLASTLFLFALGTLYGVTGTLNMADLAQRVAAMPATDTALLRVAAVLLLLVFAVKAALLPLHFWLPETYASAPAPIAALFAIMTKVGAYSILRIYTLVFGPDLAATSGLIGPWLMPAALMTLAVGMIGILGSRQLGRLVSFSAIGSMGTLLIAIALFTPTGTTAALYYLIHSTLTSATLFLVADLIIERRREAGGSIVPAPAIPHSGLIAGLFFAVAICAAGMPPFSGFVGKLLVMDAARASELVWWIWAVILTTSLIAVVGFARAGSILFWKAENRPQLQPLTVRPSGRLAFIATLCLFGAIVLLTVLAGPISRFLTSTSQQLYDPAGYIRAVLGT
jgi:multicomponent K+:H+ antiporter subunit D